MYIAIESEFSRVVGKGEEIEVLDYGFKITDLGVFFSYSNCQYFEVNSEDVPQVDYYELITKYCYTEEKGFYVNPDYVEPDPTNTYGIPDELFNRIKSDYREQIAQEVSDNGYNA